MVLRMCVRLSKLQLVTKEENRDEICKRKRGQKRKLPKKRRSKRL